MRKARAEPNQKYLLFQLDTELSAGKGRLTLPDKFFLLPTEKAPESLCAPDHPE